MRASAAFTSYTPTLHRGWEELQLKMVEYDSSEPAQDISPLYFDPGPPLTPQRGAESIVFRIGDLDLIVWSLQQVQLEPIRLGIDDLLMVWLAQQVQLEPITFRIEGLMGWLAQRVQLEDPQSIREYLLQFNDLLDLIPHAVRLVRKHFPEARMVMTVYQDPEIEDRYLVLYVRLRQYDDTFLDRLEKAERDFLPLLANKRGWIQLSTDFERIGEDEGV
jgi:hypothetical protein